MSECVRQLDLIVRIVPELRWEAAGSCYQVHAIVREWGKGQKEERRSVGDSLVISKLFSHLCLYSLIFSISLREIGKSSCLHPSQSCPRKFYCRSCALLAHAFLEAGICFSVLFSFSQHLVGDKCTDDGCNSISINSRPQWNNGILMSLFFLIFNQWLKKMLVKFDSH